MPHLIKFISLLAFVGFILAACTPAARPTPPPPVLVVATAAAPTAAPSPTPTLPPPTAEPSSTPFVPTAVPEPPPSPTPIPTPACLSPAPDLWGKWCFEANLFIHPLALDQHEGVFYLLDGGRLLALSENAPPTTLLAPNEVISGTTVMEPLDLVAGPAGVLVLDRVGDVYRYEPATAAWSLDRYGRPSGTTATHYYIALETVEQDRYLLDASYQYGFRYQVGAGATPDRGWLLPSDETLVDMALWRTAEGVSHAYVLMENRANATARLVFYEAGQEVSDFVAADLRQPRQVRATSTAVYVLDYAGARLTQFDPRTGEIVAEIPLPITVSAFWVSGDGAELVLAGRDALYFWQRPQTTQWLTGGTPLVGSQPHDPELWRALAPRLWPVQGAQLPRRENQMPGAPRHYRLGVHGGVDFYWSAGKEVRAAADGLIIRATHDYTQPTPRVYDDQREASLAAGYTPPDALDFYRGRQLWIAYGDGTVGRYAHLQGIDPDLQVGDVVTQGQVVGWVGNSGTPASEESETEDAHLHYEVWLGEAYSLGQFIRPSEARDWFAELFGE
ncbi:MAG: M23 family metallopeptidase [Chloroflexi bacterium]|nr:M23 family metallopeptidase [Chloroflexota bacterium]